MDPRRWNDGPPEVDPDYLISCADPVVNESDAEGESKPIRGLPGVAQARVG